MYSEKREKYRENIYRTSILMTVDDEPTESQK